MHKIILEHLIKISFAVLTPFPFVFFSFFLESCEYIEHADELAFRLAIHYSLQLSGRW